jgi:Tfp pilus assembly protein PilN
MKARAEQIEMAPDARVAQAVCGVAALVAILIVYMVMVANQVSSGKERLAKIGGEITTTEHQAADLKPYADFAKATTDRRATVMKVTEARFNWDRAMRQLSQVAPGDVWLTAAKGTLTPSTSVDGGGSGAAGGLRSARPGPALELSGCGKRESDVPKYMDRLYSMSGVEDVGFTKAERAAQPGATSGSDGGCGGSDSASLFSLVAYFKQSAALAALAAEAGGTAAPAAAPAAGGTTPAPATPAPATPAPTGAP